MTPLRTRRSIAGKTMLVTGANRGVGKALVEEALRRGAARVFAALNLTQARRALLAREGISVHGVVLGPVDGLERGDEDIFPDPASAAIAQPWRAGVAKTLEQQFAAFLPDRAGVLP